MESNVAASNGSGGRGAAGASTNSSEAGKPSDGGMNDPVSSYELMGIGDSNTLVAFIVPEEMRDVW